MHGKVLPRAEEANRQRRDTPLPQGEHIAGNGERCGCSSGNENKSAVQPVPKVMPTPPKAMPVFQKKATRIARWDELERREAERNGFPVWVASEQHSERGKGK